MHLLIYTINKKDITSKVCNWLQDKIKDVITINIREIARLCNVSTATISRVLNNSPHVREETVRHVLETIKKYGYTPNAFARGLGLNTMKMIGILCTNIADIYYAKAVSLIESKLREYNFNSILCCTGNKLENKKKYLNWLLEKRVDAVVLVGSSFQELKDNTHIKLAAQKAPIVIINGLVESPGVYCVLCDEKEAMSQNVQLLWKHRFRNILYVYDALTYSGYQKLDGYREGLSVCGITERRELHLKKKNRINSDAQTAVKEALQRYPETDAVIASEDLLAIIAQKALLSFGKSLPIIGFDNSILAECATPALTSVDNMLDTICPTAISLLIEILSGKEAPNKIMVSAKLVERETFRIKSEKT